MPIFLLKSRANPALETVVRARCMTCARDVAAQTAGAEGRVIWRDAAQSTVELVDPTGRPSLILKAGAPA